MGCRGAHGPYQLQAVLRARCYPALEWIRVPSNTHQPSVTNFTNTEKTARGIGERRPGNRNTPEETFFIKIRFKFHTDRSLDIEEDEGASDIEEKAPHREVLSGANPVRRRPHGRFQYSVGQIELGQGIGSTSFQTRILSLRDP
jgi:hypothetical protein